MWSEAPLIQDGGVEEEAWRVEACVPGWVEANEEVEKWVIAMDPSN